RPDLVEGGRVRRVGRLDDGVHPAAPLVVPHADDDDVRDLGVVHQGDLDLGRVDVGAAGDDQVDAPVDEVEETVFVEIADVADRAQALGGHLRLPGPEIRRPAVERRPHVDVADLAGRGVVALSIEHAYLRVPSRPPDA